MTDTEVDGIRARANGQLGPAPGPLATEIQMLAADLVAQIQNGRRDDFLRDPESSLAERAAMLLPRLALSREVVSSALDELPLDQREALLLHVGGLTWPEIANRLGRSQGAVLRDIANAYARVRLRLIPDGGAAPSHEPGDSASTVPDP